MTKYVCFIRYQILAGVIEQRMLEPLLHNQKLLLSAMCFAVRTGNTFLGSLLWVAFTLVEIEILYPVTEVSLNRWTLWTAGLTMPDGWASKRSKKTRRGLKLQHLVCMFFSC
jgi:hypothetical protein